MNYYAEAIRIMTDDSLDNKALINTLLQTNPGAIVRAAKIAFPQAFAETPEGKWEDPKWDLVKSLLGDGKKINAIKEVRRITGLGLKESKDQAEQMIVDLGYTSRCQS